MSSEKHTNRLAQEKSPYLLQHAHNPVDWYPWGAEALAKAKAEDKPIFLSIGYATCHWCHVMERESFEDESIAKVMNDNFINIKVDREERPDIDQIYMMAIQAMTGAGGWPLSAFLTPDGKPFYGGTYFPPDNRYGRPGFPDVLREIARTWREEKDRVVASGQQVVGALEQNFASQRAERPDESVLKTYFFHTQHLFDPEHGGFGRAPKFPRSDTLALLMRIYRRSGEERAWKMARKTLDTMARAGLYDHLGGGFHRYATDERWLIPHFEKMLYDNALLAQTYLEAYQLDHDEMWAGVARETVDYILRDMVSPEGGFYSAEDADSEGEEGKFYVWSEEEIKQILSEAEWKAFKSLVPLTVAGMLEDKYVLHMDHTTPWSRRYDPEVAAAFDKLYQQRKQRIPPLKDDKIIASWNGLMISACAKGARVLTESRYLEAAQRAADFILTQLWDGETLYRRYREGERRYNGSLDDYSFMIAGLLDLYETDFDTRWFQAALNLQAKVDQRFWDPKDGGYFFTDASDASLIARSKEIYDGATPSGQSVAAMNLIRLYHLTLDTSHRQRWEQLMKALAGRVVDNPQIAPALLLSLDFATDNTPEIVIAGVKTDPKVQALLKDLYSRFLPNKVVAVADSVEPATQQLIPLIEGKVPQGGAATLYICEGHTCHEPAHDVSLVEKHLAPKKLALT